MISAFVVSTLLGAGPGFFGPDVAERIDAVRRTFIEDGLDRVSATRTHRVISHPDGSLELQGLQPLRLSLQSITRGTSCETTMVSRLTLLDSPNTVRSLRTCEVEESWTNTPAGLEHAFTILRAPPGTGDVTLFVRVDGPWHHADDDGHVFKGPGASSSLRYGRAFVVRGDQRLPIDVLHVEGGLELRVPAALAEAAGAFPMEIDPVLSAEVELDPVTTYGPSSGQDESAAITVNSQGTAMVVWVDTRRGFGADLFGTQISASGNLSAPVGIPISASPGHQIRPTICADGPGFLVAWDSPIDGGFQIRARPVSVAGVPGTEFVVATGSQPALANTGDAGLHYLAYIDPNSKAQVLQIVGNTISPPFARPAIPDESATNPAIAASTRGWFAAWEVTSPGAPIASIRGMSNGVTTPNITPVFDNVTANSARRPTVALATVGAPAEDAFVFWDQGTNVGGARVSSIAPTVNYSFPGSSPALARTSTGLNVLPTLGAFVLGGRLQLRDLNDGGLSSIAVGPSPRDLTMAATSPRIFAAWTEAPRTESDIYGAALLNATASTQGFLISRSASSQRGPRVAISDNANEGIAVWIEGTTTLYGAKVVEDVNGLRVGSRFLIYQSTQTIEQVDVAALPADAVFLVTWRHTQPAGIMGALTDTSSSDMPFVLSASGVNAGPAVAFDQGTGDFVVAWNQTSVGADMVTKTVSPAGVVSPVRTHATGPALDVAISCMRSNCLLAWEKPTRDLSALLVGSLMASTFTLPTPSGSPAVAHDGSDFFLAWHSANGISFVRVDGTNGQPTNSPSPLRTTTNTAVSALSMASAVPPVIAWSEVAPSEETNVYLQRLDVQGAVQHVAAGANPAVGIGSINSQPSGAVVYQRFLSGGLNAQRVFGKGFSFVPDAGYRDGGFDAGVDAGFDAGIDAGTPDGGLDGGSDGGGSSADGGPVMVSEAGVDGGSGDGGVFMFETSGCSCRSSSGAPLALLLAAFLARRRRFTRGARG